eukprot:TRINITY_DN16476_c0_g1_i1.p1 TRINITY_DN16476_c0_g1~~TRINITY_DN16476_c0_g1_i1.p1  ORF type:complete len:492 (+),score=176.04 TRINITY_DN16476_c0_g1_i1:283-1758(+)
MSERKWRQRPTLPAALRDAIDAQAEVIRQLRKEGADGERMHEAVSRMQALREEAEQDKAAQLRQMQAAAQPPPPRAAPAAPPRPPEEPSGPVWLRGHGTPVSPQLRRRAVCAGSHGLVSELHAAGFDPRACTAALEAAGGCGCPVCRWNALTVRVVAVACGGGDAGVEPELEALAAEASELGPSRGEALFLLGLAQELRGDADGAARTHAAACSADSSVNERYFGFLSADLEKLAHELLFFADARLGQSAEGSSARDLQVPAAARMLLRHEFGRSGLDRYPPVAWADTPEGGAAGSAEARQLQSELHCCIRHFLPGDVLRLLRAHYDALIAADLVPFGDRRTGRYYAYNDPLARFLMAQYRPLLSSLAGKPLKPSYAYMISYRECSELVPHQDREAAEYVVSMQLSISPDDDVWPLCIGVDPQPPVRGDRPKPPAERTQRHVMRDGDAVVFRGRRMIHWREPIASGCAATMLLIHYVDEGYEGPLKTGMRE